MKRGHMNLPTPPSTRRCRDDRSLGAWVSYGLGSESRNLPAYVVLLA